MSRSVTRSTATSWARIGRTSRRASPRKAGAPRFLAEQRADGHWGRGFYQPKWISSHYTLLDLMHLGLSPDHPAPRRAIDRILAERVSPDGGVNPAKTVPGSDACVCGMFLNYACCSLTRRAGFTIFCAILRALDHFQNAGLLYDPRMAAALDVLLKKRRKDGTWPVQGKHAGRVHFDMEAVGKPSRWNTLRALRVLAMYGEDHDRWVVFNPLDWPVRLRFPGRTAGGSEVRVDEHARESGIRFHFVSGGTDEVYFEVGNYGGLGAERVMADFTGWVTGPESGAVLREIEAVDLLGIPAVRIEAVWPEKRRWIHFLEFRGDTYRIILDPESTTNLEILNSMEFIT